MASKIPTDLAPSPETGPLIETMDQNLVRGDSKPGGDEPLGNMGALLFDPNFGGIPVPEKDPTGPLRTDPGMQTAFRPELNSLVGLGKTFFNIPLFYVRISLTEKDFVIDISPGK